MTVLICTVLGISCCASAVFLTVYAAIREPNDGLGITGRVVLRTPDARNNRPEPESTATAPVTKVTTVTGPVGSASRGPEPESTATAPVTKVTTVTGRRIGR